MADIKKLLKERVDKTKNLLTMPEKIKALKKVTVVTTPKK